MLATARKAIFGFVDALDEFVHGIRDYAGMSTQSYVDLETAPSPDDYVMTAKDGSCVTIMRWNGSHRMVGADEFSENVEMLANQLSSAMSSPGHIIEFCFGCDRVEELGDAMLDSYYAPQYAAAKKLGLDISDVLDDRKKAMAAHCAPEYCYFALITRPTILTKAEITEARTREREQTKDLPKGRSAQAYFRNSQVIIDAHRAFTEFFARDVKQRRIDVERLGNREALRVMRSMIDPDFTAHDWQPTLPGDRLSARENVFESKVDMSELLWAPLHEQLIPRGAEQFDFRSVRIGDRIWSPLVITEHQQTPQPFQELFARMRSIKAPWRLTFTISGDGLPENGFNKAAASLLQLGNQQNALISEQFKELSEMRARGHAIIGLRAVGCTWAPVDKPKLLAERISRFAKGLQGWGGCTVKEVTGRPGAAVFGTIPGLTLTSVAPLTNAPLSDALKLLPWARPASPWANGNFILRTPDGKPFPYSAYSSKQDAWITLIFSPMGGGKSVLLNNLNLGLVLDPANDDLPLIRILDIGPSSSGFTSLLQSALPKGQEHQAQYHRIRNTHDYAMNPCDTPLGMRTPLAAHRDFLISLMCLLATPLDAEDPQDGVAAIAGLAIDMAYHRFSDSATAQPRKYARNASRLVDSALEQHGYQVDENTTWWEIEDFFLRENDTRAAHSAHRMAMPLISDIGACAMDDSIMKTYPDLSGPGGIPLPEWFRRKISEAHNQYQILQRHTRFELGDAAIIALDLDEVAKRGSSVAKRQTTIMYLISLWLLSSEFFIGPDVLPDIPELYRPYHTERIQRLRRRKKRLAADEFHRPAESSAAAVQVVEQVIREGRKWQVDTVLASQRANDFSKTIIDLATTIFVMKPPQTGMAQLRDSFQLTDTEIILADASLHGPVPGVGANMLAKIVTKSGSSSHILTSTSGPVELWGFSTTAEDRDLRDALYKEMQPGAARRLLAQRYPSQAKDEIDRRNDARVRAGATARFERSVHDEILSELREAARREGLL